LNAQILGSHLVATAARRDVLGQADDAGDGRLHAYKVDRTTDELPTGSLQPQLSGANRVWRFASATGSPIASEKRVGEQEDQPTIGRADVQVGWEETSRPQRARRHAQQQRHGR
jgi:hypothetical protein